MKKTVGLFVVLFIFTGIWTGIWHGCTDKILNARQSFFHLEGYRIRHNPFADDHQEYLDVKTWNKFLTSVILKFDEFEGWTMGQRGKIQAGTGTFNAIGNDTIFLNRSYSDMNYTVLVTAYLGGESYSVVGAEILSRNSIRTKGSANTDYGWMTIGVRKQR